MKITCWTRKLAATLAAAGLAAPFAGAAELGVNLIVNPSFENVDLNAAGPFTSVPVLDWSDPTPDDATTVEGIVGDAYAYPYSSDYSGLPNPRAAGEHHFFGGQNTSIGEVQLTQTIDLSTGASAGAISGGSARYDLTGFFSTYFVQTDASQVRVTFLDSGQTPLGGATIGGQDFLGALPVLDGRRLWGQDRASGIVPVGAASAVIDVVADQGAGNHDGYVDLLDLTLGGLPDDAGLQLAVDPATGQSVIRNLTGAPVDINFYQITSGSGSLAPGGWSTLESQSLQGDDWAAAGSVSDAVLGESLLLDSSTIDAAAVSLGAAFDASGQQDLVFRYGTPGGLLLYGNVTYESVAGPPGDYNGDLLVNAADYTVWRDTEGSTSDLRADGSGNGVVDAADYALWVSGFGGGSASTAVPEPVSLVLAGGAGVVALATRRRR